MKIFKLNVRTPKRTDFVLGLIPFFIVIFLYSYNSYKRHIENPDEKIMPNISQMAERVKQFTFHIKTEDTFDSDGNTVKYLGPKNLKEAYKIGGISGAWDLFRKGESQVLKDFLATSYRFLIAMIFIFLSVFVGLFMGSFSYIESFLYRFVLFFDKIPAMVLTPLVFVFIPVGNPAIITLIIFAVAPTIVLDTFLKVREIPKEQTIKGMTLKASVLENIFRITYAQIIPKVYDTIRLNFKSVINMLIVGELLGAEAGLGYRIFLVRRYMDMATIIPYIILLGTIVFLLDMFSRRYIKKCYVWLNK